MVNMGTVSKAPKWRRVELKDLLTTLAERTANGGSSTWTALGKRINRGPDILTFWINAGEVSKEGAEKLLKLPGANPPGKRKIRLADLCPSLADL